jgi:hypothetical protein
VLIKINEEWKIRHYVLSLPVPNEKFKEVMEVLNSQDAEKKDKEE